MICSALRSSRPTGPCRASGPVTHSSGGPMARRRLARPARGTRTSTRWSAELDAVARRCRAGSGAHAAPVDQDARGDARGGAQVVELVEGRADGPPRVQHVVDDHHRPAFEIGKHRLGHDRAGADRLQVIAIEGDVEFAAGDGDAFSGLDTTGQPVRKLDAAALDADEDEAFGATTLLDNFRRHAGQRPGNGLAVEQLGAS